MDTIPQSGSAALEREIDNAIARYPNWPSEGVTFADLAGVYARPDLFARTVEGIAGSVESMEATHIVAMDARGFVLGAVLAMRLALPLVLMRKVGKMPGQCLTAAYSLEYGQTSVQLQVDAVPEGARVLVVDDILATGGTVLAAIKLIRAAGAHAVGVAIIGVVGALGAVARIPCRVVSLIEI